MSILVEDGGESMEFREFDTARRVLADMESAGSPVFYPLINEMPVWVTARFRTASGYNDTGPRPDIGKMEALR